MDELVDRLRRVPKQPLSCQGGIVAWPNFVRGDDGALFRPHVPLWVEVESGAVHVDALVGPEDDLFRASLVSLAGFVAKLLKGRAAPQRLEVRDPQLAQYLRSNLAGTGVEVQLKESLPVLDRVAAEMASAVESDAEGPPSLLESQGITIERVHAFADAAASFYRAAPWRYLSDSDLILSLIHI